MEQRCPIAFLTKILILQKKGRSIKWPLLKRHFHTLVTCGGFTPQGDFLELPELDLDRLHDARLEAVFALYLAEGKIEPEVVENKSSCTICSFLIHLLFDALT